MKLFIFLIAVAFASGSPVRVIDRTADELKCGICQHLTQDLHTVLSKEDTQTKVVSGLMSRCESLVEGQNERCRDIVHGIAPSMLSLLVDNVHPYVMCSTLEMCPVEHVEHEETQVEHVSKTTLCEFCQFAINIVERYVQKNASIPKINETLYNFCNDLPDPLKSECLQFAPAVVKALAEGVDPHQACVKAHVCPSETQEHPLTWNAVTCDVCNNVAEKMFHEDAGAVCMDLKICLRPTLPAVQREVRQEPQQEVGAGPGCELCEFLVNTIDQYLKQNKSETAINATVTKICNDLPEPLKDTCTGFAPQLVKLLAEGVDPKQACTKIGLCSSSEEEHIEEHVEHEEHHEEQNVAAGPGCELCQFLINTIDQYLKENKTEAAINATVTNFCNELPEPLKDTCTGFAPQLVKMLAEGVDPKQACTKIGLCSSSEEEHIEEHVEHEEHHEEQNVAAGPGCELCQFLINTIDQYLKENKTEAAINATVTNFCNELPEPLKDTCTGFAPQLVKMLAEGVDPKQACTKIGLCSSSEEEHIEEHVEHEEHHEEQNVAAGPGCELCQFLINTIDQYLKENKTEAAINATVTNFCNELPEPLKDTCTGFAPQLVKLLAEGVDPKQACTKIGLCSSSEEEHIEEHVEHEENHEEQNVAAGPGCELCQFLINTIDQYLKENKTEAAINATVTNFCNELPEPLKDTCTGFAPQLVKLLAEGVDPKQACTKIGLCSSAEPEHREEHPQEHPQEHQGEHREAAGPGCELCQFLINTIDQYLKENKTEAAINATVTHFCNELPEPLKDTCTGFAPQLVKLLAEGVDPKQACTKIGLCSSYDQTPQIDDAKAGPECELCELVVKTVDKYITQNATEAAINTTILRLCQGLPEPLKTTCFQFAPEVVKALSQGVDPNMTCTKIKLCSGSEAPVFQFVTCEVCRASMEKLYPEEFKKICRVACSEESEAEQIAESFAQKVKVAIKEPDSALTCELCTLLVNTLDTYLKNNHSSAAINSTLQKICKSLPAALQIECKVLTPLLVKELAKGFNATVACTNIKACSKNTGEILSRIARSLTEEMNNVGGVKCSLCKDLIGVIDLDINGDKAKTKKQFEDVCHRLPPPTDQKCLDFVVPNFPKIWKEIVDGKLAPEKVCQTIKLC
ncbi:uncharacterized protein LOC124149338 isoform X6 [Haliotis rufescens]|uniref:uncharacterized protein LOC124149338 isoform X6 n=1 Tax=Haliotis rufescens TaxID=6454 RepID=UPI00201EF8B2|nr:uncharacterized protein LOC124149338 isoform X6 [Haliotis rufescens]